MTCSLKQLINKYKKDNTILNLINTDSNIINTFNSIKDTISNNNIDNAIDSIQQLNDNVKVLILLKLIKYKDQINNDINKICNDIYSYEEEIYYSLINNYNSNTESHTIKEQINNIILDNTDYNINDICTNILKLNISNKEISNYDTSICNQPYIETIINDINQLQINKGKSQYQISIIQNLIDRVLNNKPKSNRKSSKEQLILSYLNRHPNIKLVIDEKIFTDLRNCNNLRYD
jgi:hypothetical protein